MRLWNTEAHAKTEFTPVSDTVTMYVCGITPYETTHLGHARTYVFFDTLARYLTYLGLNVRYVQNVTDVDDPLFERARATGTPAEALAQANFQTYLQDMASLNVRPATVYPYASHEVAAMIGLTDRLLSTGHAYNVEGTVFFRVSSVQDYGLPGHLGETEKMRLSAETGNDLLDPRKQEPLDFLLWRPSLPDEPSWEAPWGPGRPGWHIECSAMAMKYLGNTIDIHGGGSDLMFPHHASEKAESESATGKRFVRHWVHTGMVTLDGTKMSKSLGNLVYVGDLLGRYPADLLRLYLLSRHYRDRLDYTEEGLRSLAGSLEKLRRAASARGRDEESSDICLSCWRYRFQTLMGDDMDTPRAIRALEELAEEIIRADEAGRAAGPAASLLRECADVLGLRLSEPRE